MRSWKFSITAYSLAIWGVTCLLTSLNVLLCTPSVVRRWFLPSHPSCKQLGVLLVLLVFLGSCSSSQRSADQGLGGEMREKVFYAPTPQVWRATQLVLKNYPIKISDLDSGLLETELIKGGQIWKVPHRRRELSSKQGLRYRLRIKVVEGRLKGQVATKVIIRKEVNLHRDFFSSPEPLPSDGLEEVSILYRIGRELQIDRALERFQNRES